MPTQPTESPAPAELAERERAYAVLDEGLLCHVAFEHDGAPLCIPMVCARREDELLLHAARGSRFFKALAEGRDLCVTVTLLEGLVLAKSALKHSVNYRSVMVFGRTAPLEDADAKHDALDRIVDQVIPGRSTDCRPPNRKELASTGVLVMPMDTVSFKSRSGPPNDLDKDRDGACWAGELSVALTVGSPKAAPYSADRQVPDYVSNYPAPAR